jgi:hypothetical protein
MTQGSNTTTGGHHGDPGSGFGEESAMSKYERIMNSKWYLAAMLSCLVVGCDEPSEHQAEDPGEEPAEYIDNPGEIKTDILRLGNKWRLSGIGDAHGNDEWLRLFNISGTDYHGGFAAGKFWTHGGVFAGSDIKLKTDIEPLSPPLDKLLSLRGVEFRWKHEPDGREIGLIAQEVEAVFPELVQVGPDGLKGIEYDSFTALMIEAMKQQQAQIASLQDEVLNLQVELHSMDTSKKKDASKSR